MTDLKIVVEEIGLTIPTGTLCQGCEPYSLTKKRGRPAIGPNNTRITDDPMYYIIFHRKNYRNKLSAQVICPLCERHSTIQKLKRHQCSSLCKKNMITQPIDISN